MKPSATPDAFKKRPLPKRAESRFIGIEQCSQKLKTIPRSAIARQQRSWRGKVSAIDWRLINGGFVMRYDTETGADGLPPGERAFLARNFRLADNYILQHCRAETNALFGRLLTLCNELPLLAEECDAPIMRMPDNFPQSHSYVGVIGYRAQDWRHRRSQTYAYAGEAISDMSWGYPAKNYFQVQQWFVGIRA